MGFTLHVSNVAKSMPAYNYRLFDDPVRVEAFNIELSYSSFQVPLHELLPGCATAIPVCIAFCAGIFL